MCLARRGSTVPKPCEGCPWREWRMPLSSPPPASEAHHPTELAGEAGEGGPPAVTQWPSSLQWVWDPKSLDHGQKCWRAKQWLW